MTDKREHRIKISAVPWRPGLVTAGQPTSIPELDLWKCANADADLDGMIRKRPGLEQWGQTLKTPDVDDTGSTITVFSDFISGTPGYVTTDNSSGLVDLTSGNGELKTTVSAGSSNEQLSLGYDVTLSANTTWSLRFMVRATNLPAYSSGTTANTLMFRGQGAAGSGKEFGIWSGGLYYRQASDSAFVLISGSEYVGAGSWNMIEVRCDSTANTTVYVNDTLIATLTSSDLATASFDYANSAFEFDWEVEGTGASGTQYSTAITTPMYNDTIAAPFEAVDVVALHDYQYLTSSSAKIRTWVAAAGNYIYHEKGLQGAWRPLHPKQRRHVHFAPYRTYMAWTDNDGATSTSVWLWDGRSTPELQDDAPPVRFLVEHQQRLCGWGDIKNPRRFYLSGDRLPNVWFSPAPTNTEDQFDTTLDAGYVEIPSRGVEVRAAWGDFFGLAVLAAEKGYWKLGGNGVFSWRLDGIKVGTGVANALSLTQVGNDLWIGGSQGITSLQTTDQYGDLQSGYPSVPIQNLWTDHETSGDTINQTYVDQMRIVYSAKRATVYIAVPLITDQRAANIYLYNTNTQKFYGPMAIDANAIAVGELASPVTEIIMVGGETGQIAYLNPFVSQDYRSDDYTMELEWPALNGRSLDPTLMGYQKTWKTLRLYLVPNAHQDFTLTWWSDADPGTQTDDFNQNTINARTLSRDFRLDLDPDARLYSGGDVDVFETDLNSRGRNLTINLQSDYPLPIQGWEVEALVEGYEAEDVE